MMALTATTTQTSRQQICKRVGMVKPFLVVESPNQPNITYSVLAAETVEETFAPLVEEIRQKSTSMDKVIVFCHTYDDSSRIYLFIRSRLGVLGVQPVGAPDLSRFRLVEMFTACTHKDVREHIG